jgi:hypothetical protein
MTLKTKIKEKADRWVKVRGRATNSDRVHGKGNVPSVAAVLNHRHVAELAQGQPAGGMGVVVGSVGGWVAVGGSSRNIPVVV